jgi:hypothetical protein
LHLLTETDPPGLDVHPSKLGAWKYEGSFTEAIYVRAKCYCEHMSINAKGETVDKFATHVAGLPESIAEKVTLDDMQHGTVWSGKLAPQRVRGGIVLSSVDFTLNINQ